MIVRLVTPAISASSLWLNPRTKRSSASGEGFRRPGGKLRGLPVKLRCKESSGRTPRDKWDIAQLGSDFGAAGQATWAETFAARIFGAALIEQPEFISQIRAIREGASVDELAARYVRRKQGRRVDAVAAYLRTGAAADPHRTEEIAKSRVLSVGSRAWWPDGPRQPGQPQRNLRAEAVRSIEEGAFRVARRGAGQCVKLDCCEWRGAKLARDAASDHCTAHADLDRRSRYFVELDRRFWRDLLPAVLDRRW